MKRFSVSVTPKTHPYLLAARAEGRPQTRIAVRGASFGPETFTVIAGPCAVEDEVQVASLADRVKIAGASALRGGAYKPRSSPYSFQGHGEEGLRMLADARARTGLPVVTEIMDARDIPAFEKHDIDVLQVGARNMQNFTLLKALGELRRPVLLKRGMGSTVKELIQSAEYVLAGGNDRVILCERGIRTFEGSTRATLDISAVPILKKETHLPVIVDPSHAAGMPDIIPALSRAAVAVGADGLIVEIHHAPERAFCDGQQALLPESFETMMKELRAVAEAVGKRMEVPAYA